MKPSPNKFVLFLNTVYMHGKNVYESWNYFFLGAQRFRNALHKCAPKPCTDLKSRNMIAFSNIGCFIDASWKLFSVALRGYTYKQITLCNSFNEFLLDAKRFRNVRQTLVLIWNQEIRLISLSLSWPSSENYMFVPLLKEC